MSTVTWLERFLPLFTAEQISRLDYLTGTPNADGSFYCKACGTLQTGSRQKHFDAHARELKKYLKQNEERKAQDKSERARKNFHGRTKPKTVQEKGEFYEKPCIVCGTQIKRTGKRGAPPKKCVECKTK